MDTRIGYHVEEKYFGAKIHQATAFAQNRATSWARNVDVQLVNHKGKRALVDTMKPQRQERQVA